MLVAVGREQVRLSITQTASKPTPGRSGIPTRRAPNERKTCKHVFTSDSPKTRHCAASAQKKICRQRKNRHLQSVEGLHDQNTSPPRYHAWFVSKTALADRNTTSRTSSIFLKHALLMFCIFNEHWTSYAEWLEPGELPRKTPTLWRLTSAFLRNSAAARFKLAMGSIPFVTPFFRFGCAAR